MERIYGVLPEESRPRWRRIGHDVYRTVGGYVTGNLLISLIAGVSSGIVLWIAGVPYAVALGLVVALLDLIPLAGATIAAILVVLVAIAASGTTAAIVVGVFFVIYQQLENHVIQPLVYGRTVQLSPLAVLVSVLIGAQIAGVLGALAAIPVAGAIQVLLVDWRRHRPQAAPRRSALPAEQAFNLFKHHSIWVRNVGLWRSPKSSFRPMSPRIEMPILFGDGRRKDRSRTRSRTRRRRGWSACGRRRPPGCRAAALSSLESGVLVDINAFRAQHHLARLRLNSAAHPRRARAFAARWPRRATSPTSRPTARRSGSASSASTARPAGSSGRSARTCSGRRRTSTRAGALKLWLASPEHRKNLLSPKWREIGVSAVHAARAPGTFAGRDVTIVTTDFGVRR